MYLIKFEPTKILGSFVFLSFFFFIILTFNFCLLSCLLSVMIICHWRMEILIRSLVKMTRVNYSKEYKKTLFFLYYSLVLKYNYWSLFAFKKAFLLNCYFCSFRLCLLKFWSPKANKYARKKCCFHIVFNWIDFFFLII